MKTLCEACKAETDKVWCTNCGHDVRGIVGSICCDCNACNSYRSEQPTTIRTIELPDGTHATFSHGHLTAG